MKSKHIDTLIQLLIKEKRYNVLMSWFLILSYAYYIRNESLVTDNNFDLISKTLLDNFKDVNHIHKHLITEDDLTAGTLFHLNHGDYPSIVIGAYYSVKYQYNI